MSTYFVRHGRTSYSTRYLLNGDPKAQVRLDEEGVRQARTARARIQESGIRHCLTSHLPRTQQTAALLLEGTGCPQTSDPRLDEPDYGMFEGRPFLEYAHWLTQHGPHARPPGSQESQREVLLRMLEGCAALPGTAKPRLVVGHGLLLSMLLWYRDRAPQAMVPVFFPEAPYVEPVRVCDATLAAWVSDLGVKLRARQWRAECESSAGGVVPGISSKNECTVLPSPEPVPRPLEENETDA